MIDNSAEPSIRGPCSDELMAQRCARPTQHPAAHIRALIHGQRRDCLLDSGADVSIIPTSFVDSSSLLPADRNLVAANDTQIIIDGEVRLPIKVGSQHSVAKFLASPNVDEVILGREWLSDNDVVWHFRHDEILLNGHPLKLMRKQTNQPRCNRCITQFESVIPPQSEAVIPVHMVYNVLKPDGAQTTWTTTTNEPVKGLCVARTIVDGSCGEAYARVCNVTDEAIHLQKGRFLSQLQQVLEVGAQELQTNTDRSQKAAKIIQEMCSKVDSSVPSDTRTALLELMTAYADVLSIDEYDLGRTGAVQHRIDTGDNRSSRQPLRPQARVHLPVIDQLLTDMQQHGVIEPCQSNWASNIVLIKKKDGSLRFCVDYRKLNDLTTKDAYPLPKIDSCLDRLAGSVWCSTFDLRSGFHQVEVDPRDVNKTTFICHRGTFRFPRMPFGLCNAPATFQTDGHGDDWIELRNMPNLSVRHHFNQPRPPFSSAAAGISFRQITSRKPEAEAIKM